MDKYSKKIIKFIKNININEIYIDKNFSLIKKLLEIVNKSINNINLTNFSYKINKIKKIHNIDDDSLLYKFYKLYKPDIIKNLSDFINYYINNNLIDNDIIKRDIINSNSNNKELYDLYCNIYKDNYEISDIFYKNIFVSIDILHELESYDLNHIILSEKNYNLSLYYYDIDNIDDYIKNIITIINIISEINNIFKLSDVTNYNIIIFLGNQKKYIFGDKITPMNINSGSTIKNIYVSVWRKEEYEKVLIHELCHYISVDFDIFLDKNINEINNLFNLKGINHISESYNETVASIINMCYKSIKLNIDLNDLYLIETKFLLFQTTKLIYFFGGNNANDLFNIDIIQNTSCLSYIIIKFILFYNINLFIKLIEEFNIICNTQKKVDTYNNFLKKIIIDKNYINVIEINKSIMLNNNNRFIYNTLRMSAI